MKAKLPPCIVFPLALAIAGAPARAEDAPPLVYGYVQLMLAFP